MAWGYANLGGGGGGAGGGLDLTIKSGPLEAKPVTAKGNFLYIVSDIPVKSYVLSYLEPPAAAEGVYWLKIMHEGEPLLNLLKKNQLFLYLDSVYVCKNAKWEKCQAFLWHDGAWIEYKQTLVIFKATPGIQASSTFKVGMNCSIRKSSDGLLVADQIQNGYVSEVFTKRTYPVAAYSTLHARVKLSNPPNDYTWVFLSKSDEWGSGFGSPIAEGKFDSTSFVVVDIPLSNLGPSEVYTGISFYMEPMGTVYCSDIWAE